MSFMISCSKIEIEPQPVKKNIFSVSESTIIDEQEIYFDLPSNGIYLLTLTDVETNQVISREKFEGVAGENIRKIYTKTIISKYLYLTLCTSDKTEISKTKLTTN